MKAIRRFLRNESGATAIEYGLIAAGISVAIIGALTNVKDGLNGTFGKITAELVK
jgi:pilus assembly protein Flp/PilA